MSSSTTTHYRLQSTSASPPSTRHSEEAGNAQRPSKAIIKSFQSRLVSSDPSDPPDRVHGQSNYFIGFLDPHDSHQERQESAGYTGQAASDRLRLIAHLHAINRAWSARDESDHEDEEEPDKVDKKKPRRWKQRLYEVATNYTTVKFATLTDFSFLKGHALLVCLFKSICEYAVGVHLGLFESTTISGELPVDIDPQRAMAIRISRSTTVLVELLRNRLQLPSKLPLQPTMRQLPLFQRLILSLSEERPSTDGTSGREIC